MSNLNNPRKIPIAVKPADEPLIKSVVIMPAYRERVYICPKENSQPGWILDFPIWWNRSAFFQKYGSRQIDTGNPFQVNYAILLTEWEAKAWDEQCRQQFIQDPRGQSASVVEGLRQWESMLEAASWVIIESYEWESGLE
jgi:hypothetical protein